MGIITCIIIASVATPLLGGVLVLTERYLRWCRTKEDECYEKDMVYVELPMSQKIVEHPKNRTAFLNKTLFEAAAYNCPILCELLIEKGANELDKALEISIVHGHINMCKTIIRCGACDLDKALKTAKILSKNNIETYLSEHIQRQQEKLL
jgi:hypothetical protein